MVKKGSKIGVGIGGFGGVSSGLAEGDFWCIFVDRETLLVKKAGYISFAEGYA